MIKKGIGVSSIFRNFRNFLCLDFFAKFNQVLDIFRLKVTNYVPLLHCAEFKNQSLNMLSYLGKNCIKIMSLTSSNALRTQLFGPIF